MTFLSFSESESCRLGVDTAVWGFELLEVFRISTGERQNPVT